MWYDTSVDSQFGHIYCRQIFSGEAIDKRNHTAQMQNGGRKGVHL